MGFIRRAKPLRSGNHGHYPPRQVWRGSVLSVVNFQFLRVHQPDDGSTRMMPGVFPPQVADLPLPQLLGDPGIFPCRRIFPARQDGLPAAVSPACLDRLFFFQAAFVPASPRCYNRQAGDGIRQSDFSADYLIKWQKIGMFWHEPVGSKSKSMKKRRHYLENEEIIRRLDRALLFVAHGPGGPGGQRPDPHHGPCLRLY